MARALKFVARKQRVPLQTTFKFMTNLLVPIPNLYEVFVPTPNSPISAIVPSIEEPYKFVLASSKTIARWFGVTCEDCPNDTIWGCYVTKSCWKVVIVALGAIFLFITLLMGIFFLGQIDDLLKYQRQLTEFEKAYPTLAKVMIFPLKQFHKTFIKSFDKTMKSLTKKFGTKPWFKFVVIMPCTCLKGMWTIFQKVLQPTCLVTCNVCEKTKKTIADTGFCQWTSDKALKKVGLRVDLEGDEKREIKAKQKVRQAKIDGRKANKQPKKDELQAKKDERRATKQVRLGAKAAKKQAKIKAREAKRKAQKMLKFDALEDAEEAKWQVEEAAEEAGLEAIEVAKEVKREVEEKASKAPPSSPALPSPPSGPPPSPIPPTTMNLQGMSPTTVIAPTAPPTIPTIPPSTVPSIMPTTPPTIILQGMSPVTMIPAMVPPTSPIVPNQQSLYGVDQIQQYVDPYVTQQYDGAYNANLYEGYQASSGEEAQVQGYGAYGQEQYGMYGNYPTYVQQGVYGQDQYGQQAMEYNYDTNVDSNAASVQQQYIEQEYPHQYQQQQYNKPQYYS